MPTRPRLLVLHTRAAADIISLLIAHHSGSLGISHDGAPISPVDGYRIGLTRRTGESALFCCLVVLTGPAGAGALLPYSPLGSTLGFVPLPGPYRPAVLAIILGYCVLAHLVKTWFVRRWGM